MPWPHLFNLLPELDSAIEAHGHCGRMDLEERKSPDLQSPGRGFPIKKAIRDIPGRPSSFQEPGMGIAIPSVWRNKAGEGDERW